MGHVEYFEKSKLLKGEQVIISLEGWIGEMMGRGDKTQRNGSLVLTNQRVAFIRKGLFGEVFEAIPLGRVTSVETRSLLGYRVATIHTSHDALSFKTFQSRSDFAAAVNAIQDHLDRPLRQASSERAPAELVRDFEALVSMNRRGVIADEEFGIGKQYLLEHGSFEAAAETRQPMVDRREASQGKVERPVWGSGFLTMVAGLGAVWFVWSAFLSDEPATKAKANTAVRAAAASSTCSMGELGSGKVFAVTSSYDPRLSPSETGNRIKNKKASETLGKLMFHTIDNSTTVKQLCASSTWSQIEVMTPEWLSHVKGWVPTHMLRDITTTGNDQRIYVDDDFYWDKHTSLYKSQVIRLVNEIAQKQAGCAKLDPMSVSLSGSRTRPGDPVFYVTCFPAGNPFNVWFRPTDYGTVTLR